MTAATTACLCGVPLRETANFCARCGREIRQQCPVCFEERRLIANRDGGASPWCDARAEVLSACMRCGRWLTADARQCPDPGCRGDVSPTWPISTGWSADGAGRAGAWRWPATWDAHNPQYSAPNASDWRAEAPVYAAAVAHGVLYVWASTSLVAPETSVGGPLAETHQIARGGPWRSWLGLDGQPDPLMPPSSRIAIVGGGAVLAAQNTFLLTGLYPRRTDDTLQLDTGTPLAQVAAEGWWVGWTRQNDRAALWLAAVPANWRNLPYQQIADAPPQSVPQRSSPLVIRAGMACWIGEDGALWQLDCRCRELHRLTDPLVGARRVWYDAAGLHPVLVTADGVRVGLGGITAGGAPHEVYGGTAPLRDLFASPELIAVVGETVTALDPRTGDSIGGGRYSGRWVAGALADAQPGAPDLEPRLLALTDDAGDGNLVAFRLSSGAPETVWRAPGVRPIGLITDADSLYVVHDRGITRLQETSP